MDLFWIVALLAIIVVMLVGLAIFASYFRLWIQSVLTKAGITIWDLLGMTFRKVNASVIVRSKIMAITAGLILWIFGRLVLGFFTDEAEVIRVGLAYLRVESVILWAYMMLFAITSFLQALKRPVWTIWISLYRQGFGIAFFIWLFVAVLEFSEIGVWFGVASAVLSGLVIALCIATYVARGKIGGLWQAPVPGPSAAG